MVGYNIFKILFEPMTEKDVAKGLDIPINEVRNSLNNLATSNLITHFIMNGDVYYIKKNIYDEVIKLVNNKYGNNINFTVEDYYRVIMSEIININN